MSPRSLHRVQSPMSFRNSRRRCRVFVLKNEVPYLQRALAAQLPIGLHASIGWQARSRRSRGERGTKKAQGCFLNSLSDSLRTSL
ncbi:hypothetical protein F2Q70_00037089 [Brassica cretica]|uniref:Uncharacterized protein n=1 Tax=Brassica cretica TaxID=69181 RepID=A0A3N6S4S5_BRACR|nr:hypothetical protein F2Q70_00037089 [Brassica cretica]KAF3533697.1 hypothetical protein DY000_02042657 [Brassica cretica]